MSNLPKGRRVKYVENFAIDLSSKDSLCCDNVRVENNVLRGFGALTDVMGHGVKFFNIIGVNKDLLYLQHKQYIYKYAGINSPGKIPMFANVTGDNTDGRYVISRNMLYLTYDQDGLWAHNTGLAASQINVFHTFCASHLDDVEVVNERPVVLFEEKKIRFTDCDDITFKKYDETSGGYFELPSRVQAIKSLGANTLYAFGETCYKITFSADEADITVNVVARGLSRVFNHSVAAIGKKIVFATLDGLYVLQGDKVTRIFRQIDASLPRYDNCYGSVWRGKYAFSVEYKGERSTYVLDVDKQTCSAVLHKDVKEICSFKDNDYVLSTNGTFSRIENETFTDSRFVRSGIDFGISARKYLRRLVIQTNYDVDVYLTVDGVKRCYRIKGGGRIQSVLVVGSGRVFDVEIHAQQRQLQISRFELLAETYKEDNYGN